MMDRGEARQILEELTKGKSLLRHARSVELVMEAYAEKLGEDKEVWAITGMDMKQRTLMTRSIMY